MRSMERTELDSTGFFRGFALSSALFGGRSSGGSGMAVG